MKHLLYILFAFSLYACSPKLDQARLSNNRSYRDTTYILEWSPDRKLTWEDFKGKPDRHLESNVAARSSCRFGIRVDTSNASNVTVVVTNEFIRHQSSVRAERKTPALLAHEQLHFDLCEVYARTLRKQLANTQLSLHNANKVATDIFLEVYKAYKERQWAYDEETHHGLEPALQQRWAQNIEKELAALSAYTR
ncbi:DUF922 domain-containing protein [Chitinophaga sp. S165]|uniref:DUF922 domain-containing protein n=1 Tax=Chitinophaga sp. S165 TaxID=2135462 RepID=UPI000D710FED|nr:DUF922 domain-containing protein [Chitinophaga sp. S165]PWV56998.1 uncharacterized protein DUF922 [Chitinophaga sp. S165]